MSKYVDYLFEDLETGEQFFVEVLDSKASKKEAKLIAMEYFDHPRCLGAVDEETAKMLGYDTY